MIKAVLAIFGVFALAVVSALAIIPRWVAIAHGFGFPSIRLIVVSLALAALLPAFVYFLFENARAGRLRVAMLEQLRHANPGGVVFAARASAELIGSLNVIRAQMGQPPFVGGRQPLGVVVSPTALTVWKTTGELVFRLPTDQLASAGAATLQVKMPGMLRSVKFESLVCDIRWGERIARLPIAVTMRSVGQATRAEVVAIADQINSLLATRPLPTIVANGR